jgi:hypothetical protein
MQIPANLEQWVKALSMLGAVVAFAWGVVQFVAGQQAQMETRRIEATKPFLERQLKLYTEATQAAATLATSKSPQDLDAALKKFWSLYWGELALVEDKRVEAAMVQFGRALGSGGTGTQQLQQASLALAHACRDSLAESWGVRQWRNPHSEVAR